MTEMIWSLKKNMIAPASGRDSSLVTAIFDGNNSIAIGYGYDLGENSVPTIVSDTKAIGVVVSAGDQARLAEYQRQRKAALDFLNAKKKAGKISEQDKTVYDNMIKGALSVVGGGVSRCKGLAL